MTNPLKGEATIKLTDGATFTLILDHEALIVGEALYGKPLPTLLADAAGGFFGATRALLYGSLRAKHPAVTPAQALELVIDHSDEVDAALSAASEVAFAKPAEGKKGANPPAGRAGTSSGVNGAKPASNRKRSGGPRRARTKSSSAPA